MAQIGKKSPSDSGRLVCLLFHVFQLLFQLIELLAVQRVNFLCHIQVEQMPLYVIIVIRSGLISADLCVTRPLRQVVHML